MLLALELHVNDGDLIRPNAGVNTYHSAVGSRDHKVADGDGRVGGVRAARIASDVMTCVVMRLRRRLASDTCNAIGNDALQRGVRHGIRHRPQRPWLFKLPKLALHASVPPQ